MNKNQLDILSCGVVRDLLPLYAEQLTGAESTAAVAQHLEDCAPCRDALAALRTPAPAEEPTPEWTAPLRKVDTAIRRRRWLSVALAVCFVLAAAVAAVARLTEPQYLVYGQEGLAIESSMVYSLSQEATEPEQLAEYLRGPYTVSIGPAALDVQLKISGEYTSCGVTRVLTEENGVTYANYTVSVWRSAFGSAYKESTLLLSAAETQAVRVWYTDYTHEDVLLYGTTDSHVQTLPRLVLNYYALIATLAAAVLGLAALLVRNHPRLRRALCAAAGIPACYVLAHLAVKFPGGSTPHLLRDLGFILVCAALLYIAGWLTVRLRQIVRHEH